MREIDIFKLPDFNSVVSFNHIWANNLIDVPEINANERKIFSFDLDSLINNQDPAYSPLGFLFTGDGGSGKTHLLSTFRRMAQEKGVFFLYTDMMTANNFWRQLTSNALESLSLAKMNNGKNQAVHLLDQIITASGYNREYVDTLVEEPYRELDKIIPKIIKLLAQRYPAANRWAHILRAFFFFASKLPHLSTVGQDWLLGELTSEDPKDFGLPVKGPTTLDETIKGLTWLMSLGLGSSILVIDQLDNIFKQYLHNNPDPQAAANNFCEGLASLINKNNRCLTVVSCLFATWSKLETHASHPARDRLTHKFDLENLSSQESARLLIASRLKPAFDKAQYRPKSPTWPFCPEFFAEYSQLTPRKLLNKCRDFQLQCILADRILAPNEIEAATPDLYKELKQHYNQSYKDTNVAKWWEKTAEDENWPGALWAFAMCFCYENNDKLPPDVDLTVKASSLPPGKKNELLPLHALLHYEFTKGEREDRFLGLRALLQKDPGAFKRRLIRAKEELTLNPNSQLRQLIMVRFDKAESFTATTKALVDEFNKLGGQWVTPEEITIRHLSALVAVTKQFPVLWIQWAKDTKPTQKMGFLRQELNLFSSAPLQSQPIETSGTEEIKETPKTKAPKEPSPKPESPPKLDSGLYIGRTVTEPPKPYTLTKDKLLLHAMIFGGSGSGKTVLIRRLVEEAALKKIPSLVIDLGNDLVRLCQKWPQQPENWQPDDPAKAQEYFSKTAFKIYTPGSNQGWPIRLSSLPDFSGQGENNDLEPDIIVATDFLATCLGLKKDMEQAILKLALTSLTKKKAYDLNGLIDILEDLPENAKLHHNSEKLGLELAGKLRALQVINPLFGSGEAINIEDIMAPLPGKTTISIFNISSLGSPKAQQIFVGQLTQAYFAWAKKRPTNHPQGLLVIDEAKEFAPALKTTPAKTALIRFASQARKYGLGLILATQEPKSVDNQIIGNCNTQFFGRLSSPTSIGTAEKLLGYSGVIGNLKQGNFFVKSTETIQKLSVNLGLSYHCGPADDRLINQLANQTKLACLNKN